MATTIRGNDNWDSSLPSNVVSATNDTLVSIATTSWVDIGLSLSITLASTASKVKLEYAIQNFLINTANTGISFRLVRDSTPLFTAGHGYSTYTGTGSNPTPEAIDAEVIRLQAVYDSLEYSRLRKAKYDLLNQDEMRYDDLMASTTTWQDAIAAIKLEFPK